MTRLNRLGCDTPVYFPSIMAKPGVGGIGADESRKFTPVPPQKGKHCKKPPANDYRIHLEPLKPLKGLGPSSSRDKLPPSERRPSFSLGTVVQTVPLDDSAQVGSGGGAAKEESLHTGGYHETRGHQDHDVDKKELGFYRQLANLRLRDVVHSEERLLKTIDALLHSSADALNADWAVLYSIDSHSRMLNVAACTKPGVAGFEVPLDKFAMEMVVTSEESMGSPRQNASLYVEDLQSISSYDWAFDVDSRADVRTCSTLASVIVDEHGRPIFVVEARSLRSVVFPTSIFAAAMTTLENIVYQYDLRQLFVKTNDAYNLLDEFLQKTVLPLSVMTEHQLTAVPSVSSLPILVDDAGPCTLDGISDEDCEENDEEVVAANREERRWLVSPNLTQLAEKLLLQSQSDAVCLLDFHPIKKKCRVLAHGQLSSGGDQVVRVMDLPPDIVAALLKIGEISETADPDGVVTFFRRLVESVERVDPLDLTAHPEVPFLLGSLEPKTVVFLPLPRTMAASYAGLLFVSKREQHNYDVVSLKPFLASLALAVVLTKKNEDMGTSTSQKKKLINLFNSHFQVENINDPSALVNMICEIGQDIFNTKRVTLYVADPIKSELWSLSTLGSVNGIRIPYGKGIAGTVAHTQQALLVRNPYEDPRFDRSFDIKFGFKTESLLTFPIMDKNGQTLGVIQAVNLVRFMDSGSHPLIKKFDEKVLDVYSHLVSHALRINSSLIMFAKVQADYWANRVVLDIHDEEESSAKHDVASVHSLLDISGFDESKRVPRNKWSTFAYACLALGKFLAKCHWKRKRDLAIQEQYAARSGLTGATQEDSRNRSSSLQSKNVAMDAADARNKNSLARANRASLLVGRWRQMTVTFSPSADELLCDEFDSLSKTMDELKHYSFLLFEGLLLVTTFRIEIQALQNFINSIMTRYRDVPYHNFYHGFDVAHSSYRLILGTSILSVIKEYEALSIIIAGLGHDADHPGNDNQFEIESGSSLALCYNDVSVLENHHAATTFAVLRSTCRRVIIL
jgi:putative methionine-R-sulfoxide reductase with GAF domain